MLSNHAFFNQSKMYFDLLDLMQKEQNIKEEINNIQDSILFNCFNLSIQSAIYLVTFNNNLAIQKIVLEETQSKMNSLLRILPTKIPTEFSLTHPKEAQFIQEKLNEQVIEMHEKFEMGRLIN